MYYPQEFREKVVASIEAREAISHVCLRFGIKYNTAYSWLKKKRLTGSLANKKWKRKFSDQELLDLLVQKPGKTNRYYAEHFKVSDALMCQRLKPLASYRVVAKTVNE